ncbi:MAG: cytidine deaminase [Candidatus Altiarchaeota archaeon]
MAKLTADDRALIGKAKALVRKRNVTGGIIGEVGSCLRADDGSLYSGVSLDLWCGVGFCAEHSAIAAMVSNSKATGLDTIVACTDKGVIPPCGRCREMMHLIDGRNRKNTWVIVSKSEKKRLMELLPRHFWIRD